MIDSEKRKKCRDLLILSLEGELTTEQNACLNDLLEDAALRRYYLDFIELIQYLKDIHWPEENLVPVLDQSLWQLLAQDEKEAQPLVLPSEQPPIELITDVRQRKTQLKSPQRKIPANFWLSLGSLAAVVMLLSYIAHRPHVPAQPVAVLEDSLEARWETPLDSDARFYAASSSSYTLLKGYAKIRFDTGAMIHLESPAKFVLDSADHMRLHYGSLVAFIPDASSGFVVDTPTCRIVDLGTEFGVGITDRGETEVQMFSGKASLTSAVRGHGRETQLLTEGQARMVDTAGRVSIVPFAPNAFVRGINSQMQIVWRGQMELDLADMVGGGNGLGTGTPGAGIDPATGTMRNLFDQSAILTRPASHRFAVTPEFDFVDSVFIPGFDQGPSLIASTGLTCDEIPLTSAQYWGYPFNGAWHEGAGVPRHTLILDGVRLDQNDVRALTLHPNMGLTFDLQRIRRSLPGPRPVRLRARVGLSETIAHFVDADPESEVWVLLDGRVRLRQRIRLREGGFDINVPLRPADQFLSLAVTDANQDVAYKWVVFVNPVIELE